MSACSCEASPKRFHTAGFDHKMLSRKKITMWMTAAMKTKTEPTMTRMFMRNSVADGLPEVGTQPKRIAASS